MMRLTRSFNKSLTYLVAVTITAIFIMTIGLKVQRPWFQTTVKATKAVKGEHKLYFPYYTIHGQWDSLLTLNNASRTSLDVALKAYSLEGKPLALPDQTLQPLAHARLRLSDLIGEVNRSKFKEGSLELSFDNESPTALGPQLTVTNEHNNLSFDMEPPMGQKTAKLEGVWWSIGDKTEANVIVSNTKEQPLNVQINLDLNAASIPVAPIALSAHQTAVLDIEKLLSEAGHTRKEIATGGISISHNGDPDALVAHGFIVDREKGVCSSLHLTDPATMKSSDLNGTGFPIGRYALTEQDDKGTLFKPILVLKNITGSMQQATVTVQYTVGDEMKIEALPAATIAPREVRTMDFRPILRSLGRSVVKDAGIRVDMNGQQGALIGELVSVSDEGICVNVPLWSVRPNISRTGAHPFSLDGDFKAVLHLKNIGDKKTEAIVHILHEAGDYALDLVKIRPGESVALDIRKLANSGKQDIHGNILPVNLAKGQVTWVQHGDQTLIGRLIQFNPAQKGAANFSCGALCSCTPEFDHAEFSPSDYDGSPDDEGDGTGHTGPLTVNEWDHYLGDCSSNPLEGPFPADATFSSEDPFVADVDIFGSQLTLVGPGDTIIDATWSAVTGHQCSEEGGCQECAPLTDPEGGFALTQVRSTSVRILKPNGSDITCRSSNCQAMNVIVGQQISLRVDVQPPGRAFSNPQWTIPGRRLSNFVIAPDGSSSTFTDLTNLAVKDIDYYWYDGGNNRDASFSAQIGGRNITRKARFNVVRPTVNNLRAVQHAIFADDFFSIGEGWYLHYGDPVLAPGIEFLYDSISIPSGFQGGTAWVQLAESAFRRRQLNSGGWERFLQFGCDGGFPYTELNKNSADDSPNNPLTSDLSRVEAADNFNMYILFKPSIQNTNTIYVPLRRINWGWTAAAVRSGSSWSLSGPTSRPYNFNDDFIFPHWTRIIDPGAPWTPE
jgi:hypothetical protein